MTTKNSPRGCSEFGKPKTGSYEVTKMENEKDDTMVFVLKEMVKTAREHGDVFAVMEYTCALRELGEDV